MPDVLSVGLGGGSVVSFLPGSAASLAAQQGAAGTAGMMPELAGPAGGAAAAAATSSTSAAGATAAATTPAAGQGPQDTAGACTVGPGSVGARLAEEALCMGGATCTASDVAVLLGRMQLGSREAVAAAGLTPEQAGEAWRVVQGKIEDCLDRIKTEAGKRPFVKGRHLFFRTAN